MVVVVWVIFELGLVSAEVEDAAVSEVADSAGYAATSH